MYIKVLNINKTYDSKYIGPLPRVLFYVPQISEKLFWFEFISEYVIHHCESVTVLFIPIGFSATFFLFPNIHPNSTFLSQGHHHLESQIARVPITWQELVLLQNHRSFSSTEESAFENFAAFELVLLHHHRSLLVYKFCCCYVLYFNSTTE